MAQFSFASISIIFNAFRKHRTTHRTTHTSSIHCYMLYVLYIIARYIKQSLQFSFGTNKPLLRMVAQQDTEVPQIVPLSSGTSFGTIDEMWVLVRDEETPSPLKIQDDSITVDCRLYSFFFFFLPSKKVFSRETFIYINGEKSSSWSHMVLMQKLKPKLAARRCRCRGKKFVVTRLIELAFHLLKENRIVSLWHWLLCQFNQLFSD